MDTLNLTVSPELVPGCTYPLSDINVQSYVLYDERTWLVVAHGHQGEKRIPVTEIANGAYYANRQTLSSETPVVLI